MNQGRKFLMCGAALWSLTAFANAAHAEQTQFLIPPQPLNSALSAFGKQSGHPMLVDMALVSTQRSQGVMKAADPEAALRQLLAGTGLTYRREGEMFTIVAVNAAPMKRPALDPVTAVAAETVTGSTVEGLIVTAQKRREQIQDVPIAISAFSADALQAQKIEGGFDLLKAIPNVTFSKNNFTGFNFSIRGIGTKAVSATTDPGVAVAFNNTGLLQNRLFEQEYFDVERVEVLRGPQGTLYGRNATAGVINVISEKADLGDFEGKLKGEVGNYHTKRLSGFVNIPFIEDVLAARFAGSLTNREGYDFNTGTDHAVNGRDLWSARLSIGFQPVESLHADFIWERFNEDDDRSRTGKQLCHRDDGPTDVGGVDPTANTTFELGLMRRALFSQGCHAGSLYDQDAFGTPNGLSLPFVLGMIALGGDCGPGCSSLYPIGYRPDGHATTLVDVKDPYGGQVQSPDLRVINSFRDPVYRALADILELNVDFDITDALTFSSQTMYNKDEVYSFQDYNRFNTVPVFVDTSTLTGPFGGPSEWANMAPGGIFCDPQLGCSKSLAGFDISKARSSQFAQEFRLQSSFDGPLNFSVGANYTRFNVLVDYYVMYNLITAFAGIPLFNIWYNEPAPYNHYDPFKCSLSSDSGNVPVPPIEQDAPNSWCPYVDPNPVESINGEGHNYFRSKNPYWLKSAAAFGEMYWQATDKLKFTFGLRYTDDRKTFTPFPSQILLAKGPIAGGTVNRGYPALPDIKQNWGEFTGRLGVDWKPELSFTDETMLYAFYSRGYKGGGANPPTPGFGPNSVFEEFLGLPHDPNSDPILELTGVDYGPTFEPEFVNAYEVGAKNTLFGGGVVLNGTVFYYDYKDYQISQIKDRTAVNENFDAKVWGFELESVFAPSEDLLLTANLGYLDTEVADGETSIDIMNRTQGNSDYILVKPWVQLPSNCIAPVAVVADYLAGTQIIGNYWGLCSGWNGLLGSGFVIDPATGEDYDPADYPEINGGAGIKAQLSGNELPNSPHFTASLGAQYGFDFLEGWRGTVRGDAYWQSQSWARIYNLDQYDKLHGWYNVNLSMWIERPEDGLKIEFYVKNVLDKTPITDAFLNSDDTALTTNVFTLDPRLIGLQITKGF